MAHPLGHHGDRLAALAELMGILLNDGVRFSAIRFYSFHFASGTPYETILTKRTEKGERIFPAKVARVARAVAAASPRAYTAYMLTVTANLVVGGKSGTGDHRKQVWGERSRLLESKFISRVATFVFFMDD